MKTSRLLVMASLLAFSTLSGRVAFATAVTVVNSDLSILPTPTPGFTYNPDGNFEEDGVPGWTTTTPGITGQWAPRSGAFDGFTDSIVVGYSNGGTLSQTVSDVVTLGDVYTLTVSIGDRKDLAFGGGADLLIDGVQYDATGTPVLGYFTDYTVTYTGLAADVGDAITIELTDAGGQASYDGVALSDDAAAVGPPAVPEPSSFVLLGSGLLGGLGVMRRKFLKA
jgi:hypothetical protein